MGCFKLSKCSAVSSTHFDVKLLSSELLRDNLVECARRIKLSALRGDDADDGDEMAAACDFLSAGDVTIGDVADTAATEAAAAAAAAAESNE